MQASELAVFESELRERKDRLQSLGPRMPDSAEIRTLLREVDDALRRLGAGSYGICEHCHDPIEKDQLHANPLIRFCLDHLTARERQALEEDLETARQVQTALLPGPRTVPGWEIHYVYQPKGVVSGDYCDVVALDSDKAGVLILLGDVAGKGVSASLLMSHLHAMFRSLSTQGNAISQMVERANRLLCESTQQSHYATLVCVHATATGDVAVCNAGHCAPLWLSAGGVTGIDSTGFPLGMFASGSFPACRIRLEPGDILLLYSDGLIESENAQGEEYGIDRLRAHFKQARSLCSAEAIAQHCASDLRRFLEGAKPGDDLTLMAIRRTA